MSQEPSADREELAVSHARPYTAPRRERLL
jgi:hypothetical protein